MGALGAARAERDSSQLPLRRRPALLPSPRPVRQWFLLIVHRGSMALSRPSQASSGQRPQRAGRACCGLWVWPVIAHLPVSATRSSDRVGENHQVTLVGRFCDGVSELHQQP